MKKLGQKATEWAELIKISKTIKGLFFGNGWLRDKGWLRSAQEYKIVDALGNPLPWYSYSAIEFLKERLTKSMTVFEYGSGYSTWFYADRVKCTYFVENDNDWYQEVTLKSPENVYGKLIKQEEEFLRAVEDNAPYDIIIIDCKSFERRIKAVDYAVSCLTCGGVILVDDSEKEFAETIRRKLLAMGYRNLKFWGGAPGINYFKCTEIFYKESNVFNL